MKLKRYLLFSLSSRRLREKLFEKRTQIHVRNSKKEKESDLCTERFVPKLFQRFITDICSLSNHVLLWIIRISSSAQVGERQKKPRKVSHTWKRKITLLIVQLKHLSCFITFISSISRFYKTVITMCWLRFYNSNPPSPKLPAPCLWML